MSNYSKQLEDILDKPENAKFKALVTSIEPGQPFGKVPHLLMECEDVRNMAGGNLLSGAYWTGMVADAWVTFRQRAQPA